MAWLLSETYEAELTGDVTFIKAPEDDKSFFVEIGPRLNFSTAWSTNAVSILHACGLHKVKRIERSIRYCLHSTSEISAEMQEKFIAMSHDRMTEQVYEEPLKTFETGMKPKPTLTINVMEDGRAALEKINDELGLAFDDWDLDYYTKVC
jgi:phosphoribosylformylglycinamidine synthase